MEDYGSLKTSVLGRQQVFGANSGRRISFWSSIRCCRDRVVHHSTAFLPTLPVFVSRPQNDRHATTITESLTDVDDGT